ncbi:hypothetical protein J2W28_000986 [Variovorax boronicumulans]|uniref:phage tail protein n=1 Tax=Variovorax boronicumulans TaxID=436515 RepID=UPI00278171C3|nr:phage tail protein [Variovorax boronicumulans]MDP9991958.1 hypothetical protein [Variovorax boronicumulans]MDQ0001853.1 hypothetical protein [Variovorax boronicumulans]
MSTQQILGVVGGVVGAFFGYPQLGFVVGSLVGGLLTPGEKTEGPRVDDLKVQVSTYGAGIPVLYGTDRVGGNVVWSTDKIEIADTQTVGKGAPEHTTYKYYVHMGIVLCETPRDGSTVAIVQIFQDGKLIYDARSGIPIGAALASAENPHAYFVLYQGHADQLPDPGEEAWMGGPGSVPAYRGVVRVRMNAIECPGGRVPQFSFVTSTSAESSVVLDELAVFEDSDVYGNGFSGLAQPDGSIWHIGDHVDAGIIRVVVSFSANGERRVIAQKEYADASQMYTVPVAAPGAERPSAIYLTKGETIRILKMDLETMQDLIVFDAQSEYLPGTDDFNYTFSRAAIDPVTDKLVVMFDISSTTSHTPPLVVANGVPLVVDDFAGTAGGLSIYNDIVYIVVADGGTMKLVSRSASDGSEIDVISGPSAAFIFSRRTSVFASAAGVYVVLPKGGNLYDFYRVAGGVWTSIGADIQLTNSPEGQAQAFYATSDLAILGPLDFLTTYTAVRFRPLETQSVQVKDIIADQCERAGEPRYDVAGVPGSDTLIGYKLQNPASARTNTDALLTAFAIYIVDEDGLIKFKKYEDITSTAEIAYDELGQAEDGAEAADAMPLNRAQEVDLPRSVAVSYIEPLRDYQTASEKEVRQITESNEDMVIEMPMVTTSDHAKQVAQMILFARWRSQNTRSFKTSRKYSFLSPGDGVTVEYPRGTFRLWRITSMTDTGALCEFNVEPGDAELYTQTAIGATGYVGQEVAPLAPLTFFTILDTPILRDQDNNAGLYVAMEGASSGYPGGELFVGDNDASLASVGTVNNEAPQGLCETALAATFDGAIDERSLLTVNVGHHALVSITRDALLNGTSNVASVGSAGRWEIIKFQRADSLGDGRYILSGLLRGLRGTEHKQGGHHAGDKFVVMAMAGTLRPNFDAGSIGQTKSYRAVTKGRSFKSAGSTTYANSAEGLRPLSPTTPRKTFTGDDIVLTWGRRTRLADNWILGAVPIGEAALAFEVVIYSDNTFATVKRTLATSATTVTYTSAQQVEDFGSNQTTVYMRIYQMSDVVGRGQQLQAAL